MKHLHISMQTEKNIKEGDIFLGPWCRDIESIKDLDNFLYHYNPTAEKQTLDHSYCMEFANKLIPFVASALNKEHSQKYSLGFWSILISSWITNIVSILHFYYQAVMVIKDIEDSVYIKIDDSFQYNKIEDLPLRWAKSDFIHSIVSFILKEVSLSNVTLIKEKINKKNDNFPVYKENKVKKLVWKYLFRKKSPILIYYGVSGLSYKDMFSIKSKNKNICFSYKKTKKLKFRESKIKIDYDFSDEFESLVSRFIEKNFPQSLTTYFDNFVNNTQDYKNRKVVVVSPGFFQDEQLFEIAFAKEFNKAKIIYPQENGEGTFKLHPTIDIIYNNIDYYLTWGWKKHNNRSEKLLQISSTRLKNSKNTHIEKSPYILYQTKFSDICGFDYILQVTRDLKYYMRERADFINKINETKLKEILVFKTHQSNTRKGYNEEQIMNSMGIEYNSHQGRDITMQNAAFFCTDYASTAMYYAMVFNIPMVVFFDQRKTPVDNEMKYYIEKFREIGIYFDNAQAAAERVIDLYPVRREFWKTQEVQKIREEFLEKHVRVSKKWQEEFTEMLKAIYKKNS